VTPEQVARFLALWTSEAGSVMFCYFPAFHDEKFCRIYRVKKPEEQELLGAGTTPQEALEAAFGVSRGGSIPRGSAAGDQPADAGSTPAPAPIGESDD
jgi:hypothetical protein